MYKEKEIHPGTQFFHLAAYQWKLEQMATEM